MGVVWILRRFKLVKNEKTEVRLDLLQLHRFKLVKNLLQNIKLVKNEKTEVRFGFIAIAQI